MSAQASPSTSFSFTDSDVDEAVGLANPVTAQRRRALLDIINRLRNTGIQNDIDLPMIAVIGSQSAGKSSLIESISGITLPRSSGTCTRCPTECKLTHADTPWTCDIKLHFINDQQGARPRIVPFGDAISSRPEVEERIRRAQRAILNPTKDPKVFLEGAAPERNETSFSKNYISLEISGRDLADLSFVDLPGLIASVGQGGNVQDIELVRDLVISYIEKPSCLILLTVACETDFENQGAHHLAKEFDPEGRRTVGVLTKPDRIPRGEEESWARLVRNEREPLANNWYCVKQPSSHILAQGIRWGEARRQEEEFFSRTQPWRSLDPLHKTYLGTGNLTERLSVILAELIEKRLPEIQRDLHKFLQQTEREISTLPPEPSSNPLGEVLKVIDGFKKELSERIEGTPGEDGLLQNIRPHTEKFRRRIRATAPKFVPWERNDAHRHSSLPTTFLANEEEGNIENFRDEEDQDDSSDDNDGDDSSEHPDRPPSGPVYREFVVEPHMVCVDEVLRKAEMPVQSRTRELPDHYPFVVQKMYISEFVQKWQRPAISLFGAVYRILKKDINKVVDRHFAHMGRGGAKQSVLMIMHEHLDEAATRSRERIDWLLQLESSPATSNTHYYLDYKNKFLACYRGFRHNENAARNIWTANQRGVNEAISALSAIGINIRPADLPKLFPSDPMEPALNIMASVRAYFQVAYKRFVDEVPNAIDNEAVRGLMHGLDQALRDGLQLTGADAQDRCAIMLQDPPSVATKRQELNVKLERLKAARTELMRLSV